MSGGVRWVRWVSLVAALALALAASCSRQRRKAAVAQGPFAPRWVGVWGDARDQGTNGVALAPDGDVVATGHCYGRLELAGQRLDCGQDFADAWVARFAPDGKLRWASRFGTPDASDHSWGVAVARGGRIFVAIENSEPADYGAGPGDREGMEDPMIILVLEPDGRVAFVRAYPGLGRAEAIAATPDGGVVLGLRTTVREVAARIGNLPLTCPRFGFAAIHLDAAGQPVWARCNDLEPQSAYFGIEMQARVAAASNGDVVLCAGFEGEVAWAGQLLRAAGGDEKAAFVVALAGADGAVRWAHAVEGAVCDGVAADPRGGALMLADGKLWSWNQSGVERWALEGEQIFGGPAGLVDVAMGPDGHLIVTAGRPRSDAVLLAALAPESGKPAVVRELPSGGYFSPIAVGAGGTLAVGSWFEGKADFGAGRVRSAGSEYPDVLVGLLGPPQSPNQTGQ